MNNKKYLETPDGHNIYYEHAGNEDGIPVVFLHGGPGSGCSESSKNFFDKEKWFSVFFDQRGCGLSKPSGETKNNNTENLVKDIEMLRKVLGIKKWVVFGGSWGSTLALKYACEHPKNVSALILRGIFLASETEIDWFLLELRRFIPKNWNNFVKNIRNIKKALGTNFKLKRSIAEIQNKRIVRKSIVAKKEIKKGEKEKHRKETKSRNNNSYSVADEETANQIPSNNNTIRNMLHDFNNFS